MKVLRFAQNDISHGIAQSEQPSVIQVLFLSHPGPVSQSSGFCFSVIQILFLSHPEFSHCHPELSQLSFRLSEANGEIYTIL